MNNIGVISMGVKAPIIREGDNLVDIVVDSVLKASEGFLPIEDKDVIGITESVVARAAGNYVTVDDIALELQNKFGNGRTYVLLNPIYSRNRFSMILKAIARAASTVVIYMPDFDEVGNPSGVNQFTGVNICEYYIKLVSDEKANCVIHNCNYEDSKDDIKNDSVIIYCGLHDYDTWKEDWGDSTHITLADICYSKCEYGLLGSNKATEEKLKLFPSKECAQNLVNAVQARIYEKTNKYVEVMVYGDGCFKDPVGGIWEWADPVVSPAFTVGLIGTPNEIKIKAFADDQFGHLNGEELEEAIKDTIKKSNESLVGNMAAEGTTPRRFTDLLGSLMDLTSGSGQKGSPFIWIKNYFKSYAD